MDEETLERQGGQGDIFYWTKLTQSSLGLGDNGLSGTQHGYFLTFI